MNWKIGDMGRGARFRIGNHGGRERETIGFYFYFKRVWYYAGMKSFFNARGRGKALGFFGEYLARKYLLKNGYKIIARNFRAGSKEIDIISKQGEIIVFVEVKTRVAGGWMDGEDSFGQEKMSNILTAASYYLESKKIKNDFRLDLLVVNIFLQRKIANIKHYIKVI